MGQNEDYSPRDRLSDSSEELLQRGRGAEVSIIYDFIERIYVQSSTHCGRGLLLVMRRLLLVRRSRCLR